MPREFESKLRRARFNCSVNLLLETAGRVFVIAGGIVIFAILAERLLALSVFNKQTVVGLGLLTAAVVVGMWYWRQLSSMQVALLVDERLRLQERFSTVLAMEGVDDPFARQACQESRRAIEGVDVSKHFPVRPTQFWFYVLGVWVFALGLMMFMPQKDLLGFLDKKEQEEKQAKEIAEVETRVKTNTVAVKHVVEQLGDSELADQLAKLDQAPKGANQQEITRQAIRKLGDLADNVKKMQDMSQIDSAKLMEQMLKQLRTTPDAFSQQLMQNLAKGNFSKAAQVMEELRKKLDEGKLSEGDKQAVSKQMQDIAKQLQELAEQNKELAKELEKLGLNKELAKLDLNELEKMLAKKGLSSEKIAEMLKKAQACKSAANRCSALGKSMGACANPGAGGDEFAAAMDALSQMDSFKEQAKLSAAAIAEIERAIACLGEGMCDGPGGYGAYSQGLSDKYGRGTGGPGKGMGVRESDDSGDTSTKSTSVKSNSTEGPVVASWYFKGEQIKGESRKEFSQVVRAGRDNAAEAMSENEIPKKYAESVKQYFGKLEEAGDE